MKKINSTILLLFSLLAVGVILFWMNPSWATNKPKPTPQTQDQEQGQKQMQGQDQSQTANSGSESASTASSTASNEGNSQSVTFSSPKDIKIKNTPNPDAPAIYAQNPCALAWSASAVVAGFGASGGKAYIDEKCNARAWATLMFQMGARDAAIYLMCQQPEAAGNPDCEGVQDYNKEMELLKLGHDQLVDDNTELRDRIDFILSERVEDQAACKDSVDRVGDELERCLQK